MELKVLCGCGQKYKFDVEPMNGQMPFAVNCPSCGVDGTPVANQLIAEHYINNPPAPVPIAPAPAPGGLKINRPAPAPAPVAAPPPLPASVAVPPPVPGMAPAAAPRPIAPGKPMMMMAPVAVQKEFNMGLGILGAFLGSAIGGALVFGFFYWAGFRFPLSGTAIGVLAGIGARMLARGTDSTLGFIAAAIAVVSILGAFFMMYGTDFSVSAFFSVAVCGYFAYRVAS